MELVTKVYQLTNSYPNEEIYGLTSQTRRAVISIPLNISEGSAKSSNKDFIRFLEMSLGSVNELETTFLIALNLNYVKENEILPLQKSIEEIRRILYGLKENLKKNV